MSIEQTHDPDCDCEECDIRRDLAHPDERRCRVCGCTDDDCSGCVERTGTPCHWYAADLCSACEKTVNLSSLAPRPSPLVYLACPYSHPDGAVRFQRFEQVSRYAAELMREGAAVFSPISHSHAIAEHGLAVDWAFWEKVDRPMLELCEKMIVLKLDGWEQSKGVRAEIEIANGLRIPVKYVDPPQYDPTKNTLMRCDWLLLLLGRLPDGGGPVGGALDDTICLIADRTIKRQRVDAAEVLTLESIQKAIEAWHAWESAGSDGCIER